MLPNFHRITTEQISVGLSAIAGITALQGQVGVQLNVASGGTAFVSGSSGSAAWTDGSTLRSANENIWPMRGTFYVACKGATAVIEVTRFFSP